MKEKAKDYMTLLAEMDGIELKPCRFAPNFGDAKQFKKLNNGSAAKMQISALVQNLPAITGTVALAGGDVDVATFPKGIPHVLAPFAEGGGLMNIVRNPGNGQILAQARLNPLGNYAVISGAFTAMSIATSQYYLSVINSKLTYIQSSVDDILNFLYGDKKAELMSEIMFTKYAYDNFSSVMVHHEQRLATIASLQNAKKIAMKDLEFYIHQLGELKDRLGKEISSTVEKAIEIKSSLDLNAQLYAMSGITEAYYSQNADPNYLSYVEHELISYIDWEENHMRSYIAIIADKALSSKHVSEENKNALKGIMSELNEKGEHPLQKSIKDTLHSSEKPMTYYITPDGEVYLGIK